MIVDAVCASTARYAAAKNTEKGKKEKSLSSGVMTGASMQRQLEITYYIALSQQHCAGHRLYHAILQPDHAEAASVSMNAF